MYKVLYILFFIVRFIKNIKIYNNKELINKVYFINAIFCNHKFITINYARIQRKKYVIPHTKKNFSYLIMICMKIKLGLKFPK